MSIHLLYQFLHDQDFGACISYARSLLLTGDLSLADRARVNGALASALLKVDDVSCGLVHAELAVDQARDAQVWEVFPCALKNAAYAHVVMRQFAEGRAYMYDLLANLHRSDAIRAYELDAWHSIGNAHFYEGDMQRAASAWERAHALGHSRGLSLMCMYSTLRLVEVYQIMGRLNAIQPLLAECEVFAREHPEHFDLRATYLLCLAGYAAACGDLQRALATAQEALVVAVSPVPLAGLEVAMEQARLGRCHNLLARLYLLSGRSVEALAHSLAAQAAVRKVGRAGSQLFINDTVETALQVSSSNDRQALPDVCASLGIRLSAEIETIPG